MKQGNKAGMFIDGEYRTHLNLNADQEFSFTSSTANRIQPAYGFNGWLDNFMWVKEALYDIP